MKQLRTGLVALWLAAALLPTHPAFAQEATTPQTTGNQQLYQQLYQAAMEDSVISPEEERLLRVLQQSLGLHEDVVGEALGEAVRPLAPALDQSGRWTLVAQNMGWGAGLYGWGIPYVLDVQDGKWYVGGVLSSLAGSFYLTWRYTEEMHLPEARSQMQRYGSALGLQAGQALKYLLGWWGNYELERGELLVLMAGVPLGGYLGDRFYQQWQPSTGMAYALSLYGEVGSSVVNSLYLSAYEGPQNRDWRGRRLLFRMAGQHLGHWLGHRFYADRQYSFGDAALLGIGRATGAFYGAMLSLLLDLYDSNAEDIARFLVSGGGVAGLAAMDRFQQGKDYTFGQSALLGLGGVAGGTFAVGMLILMEVDEEKVYEISAIGGSLAGFYVTRKIVHPVRESSASADAGRHAHTSLALRPTLVAGQFQPTLDFQVRW